MESQEDHPEDRYSSDSNGGDCSGSPRRGEFFDVVCIGGGTAGMTAARTAKGNGCSVALIEAEGGLGGDCTYWGCVPSKTLISVAGLAHRNRTLSDLGFVAAPPDFARVMDHQRAVVAGAAHRERAQLFERDGITVIRGGARLESPQE